MSGSVHITDLPWTYLHMPLKIPTLRILSFEVEESESRPVYNKGIFFRQNKDKPFLPGTRDPPCMRLNGSPFLAEKKSYPRLDGQWHEYATKRTLGKAGQYMVSRQHL